MASEGELGSFPPARERLAAFLPSAAALSDGDVVSGGNVSLLTTSFVPCGLRRGGRAPEPPGALSHSPEPAAAKPAGGTPGMPGLTSRPGASGERKARGAEGTQGRGSPTRPTPQGARPRPGPRMRGGLSACQ